MKEVDGVLGLDERSNGRAPQGTSTIEYRTPDTRAVNPKVLARLVAGGAQVVSMTCDSQTLEDVYFRVMAEGPASPAAAS